jgi:hypothetical protein
MSLSLIGAGLGRTGTLSLKSALEQLGFAPCFHGLDASRNDLEQLLGAVNRTPIDWTRVFSGYRAAVDVPAYWIYRELAQQHPAAKVILTVREPQSWYESTRALVHSHGAMALGPQALALRQGLREKILAGAFGTAVAQMARHEDRDSRIAAFERHNAEVRSLIPADRLLVFDVRQGWEPLCEFLAVPLPDTPFPRLNSRGELPSLLQRMYGDEQAG